MSSSEVVEPRHRDPGGSALSARTRQSFCDSPNALCCGLQRLHDFAHFLRVAHERFDGVNQVGERCGEELSMSVTLPSSASINSR